MKTVHSAAVAAVLVLLLVLVLVVTGAWRARALFDAPEATPVATVDALPLELVPTDGDDEGTLASAEPTSREAVEQVEPQPTSDTPDHAVTPTRLVARIVDSAGRPVAGARLDAPERGHFGSSTSDSTGHLALVVDSKYIQIWNERPVPQLFRVAAKGHATLLIRAGLQHDTDTDLGDVELAPGGAVFGRVVDEAAAPLEGVRVLAGDAGLGRTPEEARMRGPEESEERIESLSAVDGTYRLAGVAAGPGRVWAHVAGRPWAFTSAFDVAAGSGTRAPDLVLARLAPSQCIAGVVLDPNGDPVPGAVVLAVASVDGPIRTRRAEADARGQFQLAAFNEGAHTLEAFHPAAALQSARRSGVLPGDDALELRLTDIRWVEIELVDERGGTRLEKPWIHMESSGELHHSRGNIRRPERETLSPGLVRAPLPEGRFTIGASAPGYAHEQLGPFDAETMPAEFRIELKRLPMITGRVTAGGEPVAGARVQTLQETGSTFAIETEGFRTRLFDGGAFPAETDANGLFEIPIKASEALGAHVLLVSKEGWATAEIALDVTEDGQHGLEVHLTRGGAIEGEILLPAGRDPRGALVAASNGDARVLTARANEDGLFRFDHLGPGPWQVHFRETEQEFSMSMSATPPDGPYEGDCSVLEGRTTRFDIDERSGHPPVEGRLTIDGEPAAAWTAHLEDTHSFGAEALGATVVLDGAGAFSLDGDDRATHLVVESPESSVAFARVTRRLDPENPPATAALVLVTGRITGSAPADARLRLGVSPTEGVGYNVTLTVDPDGRFDARVPAGRVSISIANTSGRDYVRWNQAATVDVSAGGEATATIETE